MFNKRINRYSSKEETINKNLQSEGYRDMDDFYAKHPTSNFDVTPLSTRAMRYVGKGAIKAKNKVIKTIKRYGKKD